jgi:hypothetical protein
MDFTKSNRTAELLERMQNFMQSELYPLEQEIAHFYLQQREDWRSWREHPSLPELRAKAKALGLWNLFLPDPHHGAGLSTLEYASLAEQSGHSLLAPDLFNCNAPDTGNMEVLHMFGSAEQQQAWLQPLLAGEIRSVFAMTEPDVASSDATNMALEIALEGDQVRLHGKKWWITGIGHPRARIAIVMGRSAQDGPKHKQHSMVLVPLDTPGVEIKRMLPTFAEFDAPYGHGEVWFNEVRVPKSNLIAGLGDGFKIAQGRLGPGRIHHCMRLIGASERVLKMLIERGLSRVAFGQPLIKLAGNMERVAELRMAIDQARLLTLYAAWKIDQVGAGGAMNEISAIKVVAPNVLQRVTDEAMQMHGGAGLSHDVPLTAFFNMARALRLADGPDAVHRAMVARVELEKYRSAA